MPIPDDDDGGDISLSFPISRSTPQISSILRDPVGEDDVVHAARAYGRHHRDISSPTPRRVLNRDVHRGSAARSVPPASSSLVGLAINTPSVTGSISLNDSPTKEKFSRSGPSRLGAQSVGSGVDQDDSRSDVSTPLVASSFWGPEEPIRPSSADPRSSTSAGPSGPAESGSSRPLPRRTSSNTTVGRSKSLHLHARLPSYDLSTSPDPSLPPSRSRSKDKASTGFTNHEITPSLRLGWSRRPGEPRPPPLVEAITAQKMGRWIKEIVVCNFDLERGPVVERRLLGRRWGPGEKENVAFSSFPDTSLFAEGSIVFSFKIRHIPPDPSSLHHSEPPSPMPDSSGGFLDSYKETPVKSSSNGGLLSPRDVQSPSPGPPQLLSTGEKAEEYRKWDERGREWLYGFVWFEQRRDRGIARGYMQKSLVILTHLPFPSFFSAILHRVAPIFFERGYSALEAACHSIASWPDPSPDQMLELPLMSHVITVKLPDTKDTPQIGHAFLPPSPHNPILASLPSSTPLRTFASFLPSLWSLWECLVLAEPVLVIAPDPRMCSEIVWWLRDLFRPIPPSGDFRPYLHIHDHDFALLVNSNKPQPGVVVGVTNPFFRNAASHWPNVISISLAKPARTKKPGMGSGPPQRAEQSDGFHSRRHRSVSKDRALLKRLEALVAEGRYDDPAGNEALRTHFQQLTERMLVPLNRYFQTLAPTLTPAPSPNPNFTPSPSMASVSSVASQSSLSSHMTHHSSVSLSTSSLKPFSLPTFLTQLKTQGPNPLAFRTKGLSSKSRVENDFYASFCMSATFAGWLASRVESLGIAVAAHVEDEIFASQSSDHLSPHLGDATPTKSRSSRHGTALGLETRMSELDLTPSASKSQARIGVVRRVGSDGRISLSDDTSTTTTTSTD